MTIQNEGTSLLKVHKKLYNLLNRIPTERNLIFRVEPYNENKIGKPRFKKKEYKWPKILYRDLRDHLQELYNYFEKYSYWLDNSMIPIIDFRKRKSSKKSVIFLLERDVWETDEVYGDYLIEKSSNKTTLYYFRRDRKIRKFTLDTIDNNRIEEWICHDVIKQIQEQFRFLWSKLEDEIQIVMEEKFRKKPQIFITNDYLKDQLKKIKESFETWPEATLLSLGRLLEIWLLMKLEVKSSLGLFFLIRKAEIDGLIDNHQFKLLQNIRFHYNELKHNPSYELDEQILETLVIDFSNIFY